MSIEDDILERQIRAITTAARVMRERNAVGDNALIDMLVEELEVAADTIGRQAADILSLRNRLELAGRLRGVLLDEFKTAAKVIGDRDLEIAALKAKIY